MIDKDKNGDILNKIMNMIVNMYNIEEVEVIKHNMIKEEIYQQIGLLKLKNMETIPLEEVREKKKGK